MSISRQHVDRINLKRDLPPLEVRPQNDESSMALRLRVVRTYFQKTQKEFASLLGIKETELANFENGFVKPSDHVIQKIAAMGFDAKWLLCGENSQPDHVILDTADSKITAEMNRVHDLLSQLPVEKIQAAREILEDYVKKEA